MNAPLTSPRLRRSEVPDYMKQVHGITIAKATLSKMASVGGGPVMRYAGRIPLYDKTELDIWANNRLGQPMLSTSERGAA